VVDIDVVLSQTFQHLVQGGQVLLEGGRVDQQVINVDGDIANPIEDGLHEAVEAGRAAKQAHGAGDLLKLPHAWHSKSSVRQACGCRIICQKPAMRLMVLKIVLPDQLIFLLHSLMSFIEYWSV
jgi:hypothetical protein